jgi:uncharacterized protein YndB with AHSA1/START domain
MSTRAVSYDTFVIEKTYAAPASQVFRAFADPKRKARWFAGSIDALGVSYELDFRIGGTESNVGGPPGGVLYRYLADYRDIVVDERIIYTYEMYAGDDRISVAVATVELRGKGEQTTVALTEQGVFLDGLDHVEQREGGTRGLLEGLATFLDADPA